MPVFEGGWNCSPQCTEVRMQQAVSREFDGRRVSFETHRHRIPLGLLMLEQGWITAAQLRGALQAQKGEPGRAPGLLADGEGGCERATGDTGAGIAVELSGAAA